MKLYQKVSSLISAKYNHSFEQNKEWEISKIKELVKEHFPHGSGFDGKTYFDLDLSHSGKLVLFTEFHHMNENGYYDGWSTLKIVVKPSLQFGFDFKLTGIARKYNLDRDYFEDVINTFLDTEI